MDRITEERIAENDARFREANERIHAFATEHDVDIAVPFICECAQMECVEVVRLEIAEYEEVRRNPRWFVNIPGHDRPAGSAVRVVSERSGWIVVEKVGHAGDVAEELAGGPGAAVAEREPEG